ncbi:hypothetical protein CSUI_007442 [Cystoisospora suis]|uniref:Uncharacterized protein n=1 Tax=Cystoisospora suis TaxID=483139 RepID=A0A2C6KQK4_9APIC|nr:hypothetical protein CSUI_007442 [Cystoisospora suis]
MQCHHGRHIVPEELTRQYPSLSLLFECMRKTLFLPTHWEVISAARKDLQLPERSHSSSEKQEGVAGGPSTDNDGTPRHGHAVSKNRDVSELSTPGDSQTPASLGGSSSCSARPKTTRLSPSEAWWWLCSNPASFPFYEVFTRVCHYFYALAGSENHPSCLQAYRVDGAMSASPCEMGFDGAKKSSAESSQTRDEEFQGNVRPCESKEGGETGPANRDGGRRKREGVWEATVILGPRLPDSRDSVRCTLGATESESGRHLFAEKSRTVSFTPVRILEIGSGTGLLAYHLTATMDKLLSAQSIDGSPPLNSLGSSGIVPPGDRPEFLQPDEREPVDHKHVSRRAPESRRLYTYVACEARKEGLECLYGRTVRDDFRNILGTIAPHIVICSWMPFNIDWTGFFRDFDRARQAIPRRIHGQRREAVTHTSPEPLSTDGEQRGHGGDDGQSTAQQDFETHPLTSQSSCAHGHARAEGDQSRWNGREAVTPGRRGVEEYILIGHGEYGLVGKPTETWGVRELTDAQLPHGVEYTSASIGEAQQSPEADSSKRKAAKTNIEGTALLGQFPKSKTNEPATQRLPTEQEHGGASRRGKRKRGRAEFLVPARSNAGHEKADQRGTRSGGAAAKNAQDDRKNYCHILSEPVRKQVLNSSDAKEDCPSPVEPYRHQGHGVVLLPREQRLYWREGYARVHLKDADGSWQCSRFDNIESLANAGCSSSRISVFRKRIEKSS